MSNTTTRLLEPGAVRKHAMYWFYQQRDLAARCLGSSWPTHQAWVEDYLKAELRERLIAIGWRPKNGPR